MFPLKHLQRLSVSNTSILLYREWLDYYSNETPPHTMKNNLTEHVLNIGKEFDDQFSRPLIWEMFDSYIKDRPLNERGVLEDSRNLKFHLLLSQLKTIELLKEELKGQIMKTTETTIDIRKGLNSSDFYAWNAALSQTITLLDTIIQDVKTQI